MSSESLALVVGVVCAAAMLVCSADYEARHAIDKIFSKAIDARDAKELAAVKKELQDYVEKTFLFPWNRNHAHVVLSFIFGREKGIKTHGHCGSEQVQP